MDNIQGRNLFNCHGRWGQVGKVLGNWISDTAADTLSYNEILTK